MGFWVSWGLGLLKAQAASKVVIREQGFQAGWEIRVTVRNTTAYGPSRIPQEYYASATQGQILCR